MIYTFFTLHVMIRFYISLIKLRHHCFQLTIRIAYKRFKQMREYRINILILTRRHITLLALLCNSLLIVIHTIYIT